MNFKLQVKRIMLNKILLVFAFRFLSINDFISLFNGHCYPCTYDVVTDKWYQFHWYHFTRAFGRISTYDVLRRTETWWKCHVKFSNENYVHFHSYNSTYNTDKWKPVQHCAEKFTVEYWADLPLGLKKS